MVLFHPIALTEAEFKKIKNTNKRIPDILRVIIFFEYYGVMNQILRCDEIFMRQNCRALEQKPVNLLFTKI